MGENFLSCVDVAQQKRDMGRTTLVTVVR